MLYVHPGTERIKVKVKFWVIKNHAATETGETIIFYFSETLLHTPTNKRDWKNSTYAVE